MTSFFDDLRWPLAAGLYQPWSHNMIKTGLH